MSDTDEWWDAILERIRSLRFPPDELMNPFLARRLDAILERRRKPTSLLLALIAEHTGVTVEWLLNGTPQCMYCGTEIEDRGDPDMGGNHRAKWVHVPGGYTICYPQRAVSSPRAAPHPDGHRKDPA